LDRGIVRDNGYRQSAEAVEVGRGVHFLLGEGDGPLLLEEARERLGVRCMRFGRDFGENDVKFG